MCRVMRQERLRKRWHEFPPQMLTPPTNITMHLRRTKRKPCSGRSVTLAMPGALWHRNGGMRRSPARTLPLRARPVVSKKCGDNGSGNRRGLPQRPPSSQRQSDGRRRRQQKGLPSVPRWRRGVTRHQSGVARPTRSVLKSLASKSSVLSNVLQSSCASERRRQNVSRRERLLASLTGTSTRPCTLAHSTPLTASVSPLRRPLERRCWLGWASPTPTHAPSTWMRQRWAHC
mmetsp:Transcript_68296/g.160597  ORF Transcript_68296/g.160597 Transcript_68296/m.160597 type:complete len:231 (+) Transcript_68296:208-900(+)